MTFEADIPKGGVDPYLQRIERGLEKPKDQRQKDMARLCKRGLRKTREYAKANGLK
jgi:hypothetical protein